MTKDELKWWVKLRLGILAMFFNGKVYADSPKGSDR